MASAPFKLSSQHNISVRTTEGLLKMICHDMSRYISQARRLPERSALAWPAHSCYEIYVPDLAPSIELFPM